jgi:hypothetical protein
MSAMHSCAERSTSSKKLFSCLVFTEHRDIHKNFQMIKYYLMMESNSEAKKQESFFPKIVKNIGLINAILDFSCRFLSGVDDFLMYLNNQRRLEYNNNFFFIVFWRKSRHKDEYLTVLHEEKQKSLGF